MNRMRSVLSSSQLVPCALCLVPLLAGCALNPARTASHDVFAAPYAGDGGVVIAESALVEGVSRGNTVTGSTDDCTGPGLGVVVDGTLGSDRYLFDKNGEPCESAQTLFDGRSPLTKRQTDPAISLNFHDSLGPRPEGLRDNLSDLPGLQPIPEVRLKSELLPSGAVHASNPVDIEPAAGPSSTQLGNKAVPAKVAPVKANAPDPVVATLTSWERQDSVYANRSTEASEAAERNLNNIVRSTTGAREADEAAKLMAQLRERERQVQEEQRRHAETLERAQKNREVTTAAREQWQQKERELQTSLEATQKRLSQFEELSKRLTADKAEKEKNYQDQISNLTNDLKAAEAQADTSRRQLVLQAAAKIAEAEQLASAARLQEQEIKLREAARLKLEAETMMDRALAMRAGSNVVVDGVGAPPAVPLPLMQTPVAVQANGQTLPEIITAMLNQASPQAGQWKADWQLSAPSQHILKEKWSLTAEAPVQQVLAQLREQVRAAHGIALSFTQFGQSRLLVVTDATPLGIEDAPKD